MDRLAVADEMDLRYGYFQTDISIAASGIEMQRLRGITILDFAFGLLLSAQEVRQGNVGRVGFTESDQSITFTPQGQVILVEKSWGGGVGACGIEEFISVVSRFCSAVLEFIDRHHPAFQENPAHSKIVEMLRALPQ
ncbi:hypothetical protein OG426_44275 [Streptomyces canus]|nr:hypothetical protein OG426_44275 [Streptomyces canus]